MRTLRESSRFASASRWIAMVLGLAVAGPASAGLYEPPAEPEPASPTEAGTETEDATPPSPSAPTERTEADVEGPTLIDGVLPSGLRVILAQDTTLPVASVVLAIETGTEDDPSSQPGLVHALAYHLLQGNREMPPGGATALVHDRGGIASLAIGPAQVRYESLVPLSALSDVLWAESQRLRAPTVSAELWSSTLRWARRDKSRAWRIPRAAMAVAHGVPGLDHDGRKGSTPLAQMVPRAIGQALADRFRYELATLVVVSPHPPQQLRETIEELFADLPPQPRRLRNRSPKQRVGTVPQAVPIAGEKGQRFVWPVEPDPAHLGEATVWCKAINRQRRDKQEPARARLRCHLDVDPRRATLILLATGVEDPTELVRTRLARLGSGEETRLLERQRQVVLRDWTLSLRTPLPLARRLATSAPRPDTEPGWTERPVDWLTGVASLDQRWTRSQTFGPHLQLGAAIFLVPPESNEEPTP